MLGAQYWVLPTVNVPAAIWVPPTAVTYGLLARKLTAADCWRAGVIPGALLSGAQLVDPLSPELATTVCPWAGFGLSGVHDHRTLSLCPLT